MAVIIQYQPPSQLINMGAYAKLTNIILDGAPANTKYVLQLWDESDTNKLVDVRQSQNVNGKAVFDLGEILQNYVETAKGFNTGSPFAIRPTDVPWANLTYSTSRDEIFPYIIKVGSDDGATVTIDTTYTGFNVWNAKHNPNTLSDQSDRFNAADPKTQASVFLDPESPGCITQPRPQDFGNPLTDRPRVLLVKDGVPQFNGGYPQNVIATNNYIEGYSIDQPAVDAYLSGNYDLDVYGFTTFWRNDYDNQANYYNTAIGGIRFDWYDGDTLVGSDLYENTTVNNGGPDTTPRQGNPVVYPYNTIGLRHGTVFTSSMSYRTASGTTLFQRPAGLTHYYVYPVAAQGTGCPSDFNGFSDYPTHAPIRVNLQEEYFTEHLPAGKGADLRGCTDYTPVQFRWTNTIGYQDHAWFMKKNTYSKNIKRETYFKDNVDYAANIESEKMLSTGQGIDVQLNGTTSYNQSMEEIFTATTGYMHEEFAKYLQYMFQSPNISANGRPIQLLTTSWTEKTFAKDKLFQYEVRYKLATPNNLQND